MSRTPLAGPAEQRHSTCSEIKQRQRFGKVFQARRASIIEFKIFSSSP